MRKFEELKNLKRREHKKIIEAIRRGNIHLKENKEIFLKRIDTNTE